MLLVTVLLCAAGLAAGQTTAVSRCVDHPVELPLNTYVEGCETPPCLLPQGQDAVIHLVFRAPYTVRQMTSYARAILPFLAVTYPLGPQAVTCDFLTNTYCPILEGEIVKYTLRFFIESFFPPDTSLFLEFRVEDEARVPLLCTRFSLRVVPSLNPLTANSTILNLIKSVP